MPARRYVSGAWPAHWPDESTPIDETLKAFGALMSAGKVRHIGASNYSVEQLEESLKALKTEYVEGNMLDLSVWAQPG